MSGASAMGFCRDCGVPVRGHRAIRCRPCSDVARRDTRTVAERILANIATKNGCWEWQGAIHPPGYGRLAIDGRITGAHRAAFEAFIGPIPDGLEVCHHCDNRRCVNPAHLFAGTRKANMADCVSKGRQAHGERSGAAKLTELQVAEIRELVSGGLTQNLAALRFGVSQDTVSALVTRRTWGHVA